MLSGWRRIDLPAYHRAERWRAAARGSRRASGVALIASLVPGSIVAMSASAAQAAPRLQAILAEPAIDSQRVAITGDRLSGIVLPMDPISSDISLFADRAWTWQVNDTQRIELRGDVRIRLGAYSFSSAAAQVWINRLPVRNADGTPGEVNQIAIYFLESSEPKRRAGFGAAGKDLLVTASARGEVLLNVAQREREPPAPSQLLGQGQARLGAYLRGLVASTTAGKTRLSPIAGFDEPKPIFDPPPQPGQPAIPTRPAVPQLGGSDSVLLSNADRDRLPIVRPDGVVSFAAREIVVDEQANAMTIEGSVQIEYSSDVAQDLQRLELRAERAVVFLVPGAIKGLRDGRREMRAGDILGVYAEGGVIATDGSYALRGSKVYYDFANNRATVVDAVLRTYARRAGVVTLYARAAEMRQVAANQFEAKEGTVSTSEFFIPHLSIGAERVTVTNPPPGVAAPTRITAEDITFRAGTVPYFYLPSFEGTTDPQPLRGVRAGYRTDRGLEIMTRWDLYQLFGMTPPDGFDAELTVGGYTERGPALGTKFALNQAATQGELDIFGFYDFGGTDRTTAGLDVEQPNDELRGIVEGEFQTPLSAETMLQAQLAYVSDGTFVNVYRRNEFSNRREFETSVYLLRINENTATSLLFKYGLTNYISTSYLLASRGYAVDKLPEIAYRRYTDDIFRGLLWTQQWSAGLMSIKPANGTPGSLGIPASAFGLTSQAAPIEQAYENAGYSKDFVARVDTRHELALPFGENNWNFVPFVHAEATGYANDEFSAYSPDASSTRFLLGGGTRTSTRFVHVDDRAESRLFDIHRVRHILEPNALLWYGYDTQALGTLPIYDQEYEGAGGGAVAQLALRQQWQTQRGGPGAWQSVNFLTIDAGAVLNTDASNFQQNERTNPQQIAQSPVPALYSWRPELSQFGSHLYGMGSWQISDTFTLAGTGVYMLEDRDYITNENAILRNLARGSIGLEMRHSPDVSTYLEYRFIAPTSSELLQFGVLYQLGKKYMIALSPQYDLQAGELRRISGALTRTLPDFNLSLVGGYDIIEDQTTISLNMRFPPDSGFGPASGVITEGAGP